MLIREFLTIPAVIPYRNNNSIPLSTPSVLFSNSLFHFKENKLSVRSQTSSHVEPFLNPKSKSKSNGEEETDPTQFPFAQGIVGDGMVDGESTGMYSDFDADEIGEENYDKDPEFADILNNCMKDPQKGRARVISLFLSLNAQIVLIFIESL